MRFWAVKLLFLFGSAVAADRLPGYGADAASFTVSGVSSGGNMAVQLHLAHSSRVSGLGAIAAGPYYCAQGSLWTALNECMAPSTSSRLPRWEVLKSEADRFARERLLDPTSNIARSRVWLFAGMRDRTVTPEVVAVLERFYVSYGTKPAFVNSQPAGHGMVTQHAGAACGASEPPFINDCDYDAAGEMLRYLLGRLEPPAATPGGRLIRFDQNAFAEGNAHAISMAQSGYAYVPRACEAEACKVHVVFHGCRQGAETIGERFVRDASYNRWADTNAIIVLYPQASARYWWIYNPRGCWDWWGYTGSRYATKEGPQIRAVLAMVERLSSPKEKNR
jgi:poly(3-hydroxybutyrate) depolymerase